MLIYVTELRNKNGIRIKTENNRLRGWPNNNSRKHTQTAGNKTRHLLRSGNLQKQNLNFRVGEVKNAL